MLLKMAGLAAASAAGLESLAESKNQRSPNVRPDPKDIAEMAAGFFADVPDMSLTCDEIRCAGSHAAYVWTFTGHDAKTNNPLKVRGWEEWDIDPDLKVRSSRGWYDAEDYAAQVAGG